MHHSIITINSSKLRTPSPLRSNLFIITSHSSIDLDSPSLPSIVFKSLALINPQLSISYKRKASLKSCNFSSSPPASISLTRSSNPNKPSPSESNDSTASSASFTRNSPAIKPRQRLNSDGETFPSPFSSRWRKTTSNSLALTMLEYRPKMTANRLTCFACK
ncbi:hypothetical protein BDE02_15G081500 [Populus trichocarpa]|nr:hypothetical protein BDE02_15G081500 [Populus trichocarpa]